MRLWLLTSLKNWHSMKFIIFNWQRTLQTPSSKGLSYTLISYWILPLWTTWEMRLWLLTALKNWHSMKFIIFNWRRVSDFKICATVYLNSALCYNLSLRLRWIKEWICSKWPITIGTIVKTWLCQGSRIWPKCDVTRKQRPMRAFVLFTLQRNLLTNMHRTWLLAYSSLPAFSGRPASFISTCFYSS